MPISGGAGRCNRGARNSIRKGQVLGTAGLFDLGAGPVRHVLWRNSRVNLQRLEGGWDG